MKSLERVNKIAEGERFNVLLLDWPSGIMLAGLWPRYAHGKYLKAGESGDIFSPLLRRLFWTTESNAPQVRELDLVSHSMGAEVSQRILRSVPGGIQENILIAPCTYAKYFEQDLKGLASKVVRVTAYGSTIDKVLAAGHAGNQGYVDDSRSLGTLYRHRYNDDYDLINVTCQYPNWSISNLVYAHFPKTDDFYEDLHEVLQHSAIEERANIIWVEFKYRTPLGFEEFRYSLWNMGDWACSKAKQGTMRPIPRR